jgi:hypothetical protein
MHLTWHYVPFGHLAGHSPALTAIFALTAVIAVVALIALMGAGFAYANGSAAPKQAWGGLITFLVAGAIALPIWLVALSHGPTPGLQNAFEQAVGLLELRNLMFIVAIEFLGLALIRASGVARPRRYLHKTDILTDYVVISLRFAFPIAVALIAVLFPY